MTQSNNSYPPEQLIQKWSHQASSCQDVVKEVADWQLDRCCEHVSLYVSRGAARLMRKKCRQPSLKQRALIALLDRVKLGVGSDEDFDDIQEALEALPGD
jgi:hypothetical protein